MGQCYLVEAKFIFKNNDPTSFCKIIKDEVLARDGKTARFATYDEHSFDDPIGCFKVLTTKDAYMYKDEYIAAFDASYGWECVMYDIFKAAMQELDDQSYIVVYPDNGWWELYIQNGKLKEDEGTDEDL